MLPFGVRGPESISPDGQWETVARIPAMQRTRPSDEPTLELPVVRLDVDPAADPGASAPVVIEGPWVAQHLTDHQSLPVHAPPAAPFDAGRAELIRTGVRVRGLFATLVEAVLELLVALLRLLVDGVTALYRILQRFGTVAIVVAMALVTVRMIPWAELAAFVRSLSAPP